MTVADVVLTAYCACVLCCGPWAGGKTAAGVTPAVGFTVACDPRVFPLGTILHVEGRGKRMCQDVGSGVKGLHVDEFVGGHEEARHLGRRRVTVRVLHVPEEKGVGFFYGHYLGYRLSYISRNSGVSGAYLFMKNKAARDRRAGR